MSRRVRRLVASGVSSLMFLALAACFSQTGQAETRQEKEAAAGKLVAKALLLEAAGKNNDRAAVLADALEKAPELAAAHWHNGEVQFNKEWVKAEDVPGLVAQDKRLAAYFEKRDEFSDTVDGQLALADWCAKRSLSDQERAHLMRVLELAPEHPQARERLGYRQIDGVWLTPDEVSVAAERNKKLAANLAEWRPRVEKIRQGLTHASSTRRLGAREKLRAIDDAAAIPALEVALGERTEEISLELVATLGSIKGSEASLALARQAVLSPWAPVRTAAIAELKKRPQDSYVPALLSAMYTPSQSQAGLHRIPGGRLLYRHAIVREGKDAKELAVFDTAYTLIADTNAGASNVVNGALVDTNAKFQAQEQRVAEANRRTALLNERIAFVLGVTTRQLYGAKPEPWWAWWDSENEVYQPGGKATQERYAAEQITLADVRGGDSGSGSGGSGGGSTGGGGAYDCLAAGTKVWTARGAVAVETIRVGDLVLSQHPTTGELDYKPVLRTTMRPVSSLVKLRVGGESLMTSGGHKFWAAGRGWAKARQLQDGASLHSLSGSVPVEAAGEGDVAKTYNLVVADFHTYFVTDSRILSHDNTIPPHVDAALPGLAAAAAK